MDYRTRVPHLFNLWRGIDMLNAAYNYLDLIPKGRDEVGHDFPQFWVHPHDEYGKSELRNRMIGRYDEMQ